MKKEWCTITVSSGHKVKIDREDLDCVNEHSWRVTTGSTGRLRVVTSIRSPKGSRSVTLGRFLMQPPKSKQVYPRRFNDGLDYRKDNLVICTMKERQRLISKRRTNTSSPYKGVSYLKAKKKWRAGIEVNSVAINLGDFMHEEDAALAYNVAARKHFGDIAYQNQIKKAPQRKNDPKKR
ncbi:MAG: hypothetical protein H7061_13190 [Bdellovibrionaceae bacterium]|nr:hypothetical protein [Bdellovibrio sp.]